MAESQEDFVFLPLGGIGEIGMNAALYGYGPKGKRKWIMVDCGLSFAGPDLPGIDLIMPDTAFIEKMKKDLVGIVITHAHEDHIGAIADLWPRLGCPVYATQIRRRPAREQAPVGARRAARADPCRRPGRDAGAHALRDRIRARRPFDPRGLGARHPHPDRARSSIPATGSSTTRPASARSPIPPG
jgi:glyoxylase-like metal-dependent hydrolase (beta-lactamase superfamily II)